MTDTAAPSSASASATSAPSSTPSSSSSSSPAGSSLGTSAGSNPNSPLGSGVSEGDRGISGTAGNMGEPAPSSNLSEPDLSSQKFKVVVDGKEEFISADEMVKRFQTARAAQKRFEEASLKEQRAVKLLEQIRADPLKVLSNPKLGLNMREVAENFLYEQIQQEMMTPEQRAQADRDKKLNEYETAEKQRQEQYRAQELEHRKEEARQNFSRQFIEVLEKSGVPKSPEAVARMASYMQKALKAGVRPDPYDVAQMVKEDFQRELWGHLDSISDDEEYIRAMGPERAERVRKYFLAKVQSASPTFQKPATAPAAPPQKRESSDMLPDDFWEKIKARVN